MQSGHAHVNLPSLETYAKQYSTGARAFWPLNDLAHTNLYSFLFVLFKNISKRRSKALPPYAGGQ